MISRFLKNIAIDLLIVWPLLYFGLFLQAEYAYNLALAFFWFFGVGGIIGATGQICSDDLLKKAIAKHKPQLWVHRKYQIITSAAEIAAIFAMGYFWLGGFYLVATIFIWSAKSKVEEGV